MVNNLPLLQKHKIFVEGKADQVFIRDILNAFYGIRLNDKELKELIITTGGKDKIHELINTFHEINTEIRKGGKNLVIFDADYIETGGGHTNRSNELINLQNEYKIYFDFFLFIDHNHEEGTLESLLETCFHPKHAAIAQCWQGFEDCVQNTSDTYTIPAKKSKIYLYLECLHGKTKSEKEKIKDPNRNFTDNNKWVFNFEENRLLGSLKMFFDENFGVVL